MSKVHTANSGRLFWISDLEPPKNIPKSFYFNIDNVFIRSARICSMTASMRILVLSTSEKPGSTSLSLKSSFHIPSTKAIKSTTLPVWLLTKLPTLPISWVLSKYSLYNQIISLGRTAKEAFEPFKHLTLRAFRDAGYADCTYKCTVRLSQFSYWIACKD